MRFNPTSLCLLILATTSLSAQGTKTTLPIGFANTAGQATFIAQANSRLMGFDWSHGLQASQIKSFALRRGTTQALQVSLDLSLDFGAADISRLSEVMGENIIPSTRTTVFPRKRVSWNLAQATALPAPFDLRLGLTTPYYHLNVQPFCWDLEMRNSTLRSFSLDAQLQSYKDTRPMVLGKGCQGFTLDGWMNNQGPSLPLGSMRMTIAARQAPANVPLGMSLDLRRSNVKIPGLCEAVYAQPLILVSLGASDSQGAFPGVTWSGPYLKSAEGSTIVCQAIAPDKGRLLLSNGVDFTIPKASAGTFYPAAMQTASLTGPGLSRPVFGGSVIIELGF